MMAAKEGKPKSAKTPKPKKAKVSKPPKPDEIGLAAVDAARAALLEEVSADEVGEHAGAFPEGKRVSTHLFACTKKGYRGWHWSVTVARAPKQRTVTVDEVVLLPGEAAIIAPEWLPWKERIRPGDLSPGDLLPTEEDDVRLAPAYTAADEYPDPQQLKSVADELGLGRSRVLSVEGREEAARRWYDGAAGPESPLAQSAPGTCLTCGFMVRLAGPLSQAFAVCANGFANDDGKVVSLDHGCGAHSEVQLSKRNQPQPLPDPSFDTLTPTDFERF